MNSHSQVPQNGNGIGKQAIGSIPRGTANSRPEGGMGWKLTIAAVLLAGGLSAGFYFVHHDRVDQRVELIAQANDVSSAVPTVDAAWVKPAPPSQPLVIPGETHGWYQSTIYARVDGYVQKWTADIGDKVHKGQVLATIATPDLDAQLQAAVQQLSVAKSGITVAQANTAFAKTTYERWRDSPKGVVAPQETDEKKAAYDSSVAELQAAQAKVSAAAADVQRLQAMENFKQVTAPFDGIITMRRIDIGNLVTAGSTSNTSPLYDLAQADVIRVFADVPQDASSQIAISTPVQVTSDNFPGRVFDGKVARTSRAIDVATNTLKVEVDIPNPDLTLMPGMYIKTTFEIHHNPLLEVPASALIFGTGGPEVATIDADGKVKFQDVKISVDNGSSVDIGSGLTRGERVALNLSSEIADGERVKAVNTNSSDTAPAAQPHQTTAMARKMR